MEIWLALRSPKPRFMISVCHTPWDYEQSLTCEISLEIKSPGQHVVLAFSHSKTPCLDSTVSPRIPKCQSSPQLDMGRTRAGLTGERRGWKSCLDRQPQYLNLSVHMWTIQEAPYTTPVCRQSPGGWSPKTVLGGGSWGAHDGWWKRLCTWNLDSRRWLLLCLLAVAYHDWKPNSSSLAKSQDLRSSGPSV